MDAETDANAKGTASSECSGEGSVGDAVGSKRPRKEKYTREEMQQFWKRKKAEKRVREKQLRSEKTEATRHEWEALAPEEQERRRAAAIDAHNKRRLEEEAAVQRCTLNLSDDNRPALLFDVSFEPVMTESDLRSTLQQLKLAYSGLRRHQFCLRPMFVGWGAATTATSCQPSGDESVKKPYWVPNVAMTPADLAADPSASQRFFFGRGLVDYEGFRQHPPVISPLHWSQWAPDNSEVRSRLVYLTADSDTVLHELDPRAIYIVGAFVDHNTRKGLTHRLAEQFHLPTARFPLDEVLGDDIGRVCKVITVNQVAELLAALVSTGDWKAACRAVLPMRRADR